MSSASGMVTSGSRCSKAVQRGGLLVLRAWLLRVVWHPPDQSPILHDKEGGVSSVRRVRSQGGTRTVRSGVEVPAGSACLAGRSRTARAGDGRSPMRRKINPGKVFYSVDGGHDVHTVTVKRKIPACGMIEASRQAARVFEVTCLTRRTLRPPCRNRTSSKNDRMR